MSSVQPLPAAGLPCPHPVAPFLLMGGAVTGCAMLGPHVGGPAAPVMVAILLASLTSGIAGFASSAICGAVLFRLWDDPVQVVQVMMACSIANQAMMVWALRRGTGWRDLGAVLAGGALGLPFGIWALLHADRRLYTHALGILLLAYGSYMLASKPCTVRRQHAGFDLVAGFLGGITGGMVGFPGAPVSIWCGMKGWDKVRQRAVFQPFILVMQAVALLAISALQRQAGHGVGFNPANLLCIPAGLSGTWIGMTLFQKLSDRQFAVAVNALLVVSGLSYAM